MKHRARIAALALLFAVSMTTCDAKNAAIETEASQETTEATVAEPVMITVEDLKPLADKGTLSRECLFFIEKTRDTLQSQKAYGVLQIARIDLHKKRDALVRRISFLM